MRIAKRYVNRLIWPLPTTDFGAVGSGTDDHGGRAQPAGGATDLGAHGLGGHGTGPAATGEAGDGDEEGPAAGNEEGATGVAQVKEGIRLGRMGPTAIYE